MNFRHPMALLALCAALGLAFPALAQVAGSSTSMGVTVTESTQLAMGWSVKHTLLGKTVYNEQNQKIGKVADLIISPDKKLSYVIVGAGGFVGIGRHDVAVPVMQIQDQAGKLVMAGATRETIKSLPRFDYPPKTDQREKFVAMAERDIEKGQAKLTELEKKAATVTDDARAKMDVQITALRVDIKSAEAKVLELKTAAADRWHQFEAGVNAAMARMRKSVEAATG